MEGFEADKGCFLTAKIQNMRLIQEFLYEKIYKEFSTHAISTAGQQAVFRNMSWCVPLRELKDIELWVENR